MVKTELDGQKPKPVPKPQPKRQPAPRPEAKSELFRWRDGSADGRITPGWERVTIVGATDTTLHIAVDGLASARLSRAALERDGYVVSKSHRTRYFTATGIVAEEARRRSAALPFRCLR